MNGQVIVALMLLAFMTFVSAVIIIYLHGDETKSVLTPMMPVNEKTPARTQESSDRFELWKQFGEQLAQLALVIYRLVKRQ